MRKLLLVSAVLALSSVSAFAAGNFNVATLSQFGVGNGSLIGQGGALNLNVASTRQVGAFNGSTTLQGGVLNINGAQTIQFGVGNGSIISQQ